MAWHWFASSPWAPVPLDKFGGFVLVDLRGLEAVQRQLSEGEWYQRAPCLIEARWRAGLLPQYLRLCRRILAYDERLLSHVPAAILGGGLAMLPSALTYTVKNHKGQGASKFRVVHSSSAHGFLGATCWLTQTMVMRLESSSLSA